MGVKADRWTNNHEKPSNQREFGEKSNIQNLDIHTLFIWIFYRTPLFCPESIICFAEVGEILCNLCNEQSSVLLWAALSHSEINTNKTKTLATESICTKIDDYQNEPIKLLYVGCLTHLESILHTVLSKHENTLLIQVMFPKTIQRNTQKRKTGCFNSRLWNSILLILHLTNILHYQHSKPNALK